MFYSFGLSPHGVALGLAVGNELGEAIGVATGKSVGKTAGALVPAGVIIFCGICELFKRIDD